MAKGGGGSGIFRMDGPFIRIGNLVFDFIFANILWIIVSGIGPAIAFLFLTSNTTAGNLPWFVVYPILFVLIIHWGPASTAMYYTFGKRNRGTDSYTFRDFWHAYRSDYKQSIICSAIFTIFFALLGYNILILYTNPSFFGISVNIVIPLEVLVAVEALFVFLYLFPMLARFEMSTKDLFRNSFLMSNKHLPFTLLILAIFVGCAALVYYVHIAFVFILVSVYSYLAAALLERVFRNYMPNEDEELEHEDLGDFSISDERQAIINRYLGRSTEDEDEGGVVLIDENGAEIREEDYKVVKVEEDPEKTE